jgi:Zn-dependent peptidase ImmA (M78 family)
MSYRDAILRGVQAADALHENLRTREPVERQQRGNIDVFGSILQRDVWLVFRPLEGLLGACVDGRGVIISTNRPLAVQRFTAAHELGHVAMEHPLSVDGEEILAGEIRQDIGGGCSFIMRSARDGELKV